METWSEVAEVQPLASKIITNSMKKDRISHAYLLQGERGTGKEAIALLIAKGIFCETNAVNEPCQTCNACKRITSGNHPDVHWIEPDGQSIKIDQIRNLQKEFTYSGLESNKKVYIIKGADTLTVNAANRILKFLEEPSKRTTAIMLTDNSQAILPTIRSRCQVIDLRPLHPTMLQKQLIEEGMHERNAVLMSTLTNRIDDAFTRINDEWFASARKIVVQLIEVLSTNPEDIFLFIHQHWVTHFKDRNEQEEGLDLLLIAMKDILYYHIENEAGIVFFAPSDELLELAARRFSQNQLVAVLQAILQAKRKLKQNVHPTLVMEQLTLQIQR
ncbi:DNA polymerase III subunit delta' [Virgibacillus sp. AGTR]|uniref:DNA polymerase III subunit delta n=1 Tax=Virgibacillus salarius TaxID=447199 RepID=A0A941DTB0_9BACI|nr:MULTISPECIES: DNA polymerase III subunit delta' [Bacillaceae]NAZ09489.1 DNA polymerase III subunit delta' [Agaribacter marinus]MBR7796779.1 DNA polymerase III subunit delta' [Virgibacillus salarius]MCC2250573.1 DNA polymerase III subunit delta' [Virgibacillus sp. AGTR]MDY7045090.1 DNA polymerase III subunit delta' [Virgibacillus sp. M23]QRZ19074.1 DNA polymerase III subunit delta' [Virgibacillus sp. AGTR]